MKVVNKPATKGGEGEEENRDCRKGGPTKLPAKGGGQQQRPGKEEPLVGWRKEGASDHHQSWSQFLVGFIHPVWWHPPDDGRLRQAVADAEQPQVGDHPSPFGRRVSSQGREKETRKKKFSSKWQIWGEGDIL